MLGKVLAGAAGFALAVLFGWFYGRAEHRAGVLEERVAQAALQVQQAKKDGKQKVADQQRVTAAAEAFADRAAALRPEIIHSTEVVREYAETDAGRVVCLGADRVRGIEQDAARLGLDATALAGDAGTAVHGDAPR